MFWNLLQRDWYILVFLFGLTCLKAFHQQPAIYLQPNLGNPLTIPILVRPIIIIQCLARTRSCFTQTNDACQLPSRWPPSKKNVQSFSSPNKINGWKLKITQLKEGNSSEPSTSKVIWGAKMFHVPESVTVIFRGWGTVHWTKAVQSTISLALWQ